MVWALGAVLWFIIFLVLGILITKIFFKHAIGNWRRARRLKRAWNKKYVSATFKDVNVQAHKGERIDITPEGIFRDGVLERVSDEVAAKNETEDLKKNPLGD